MARYCMNREDFMALRDRIIEELEKRIRALSAEYENGFNAGLDEAIFRVKSWFDKYERAVFPQEKKAEGGELK